MLGCWESNPFSSCFCHYRLVFRLIYLLPSQAMAAAMTITLAIPPATSGRCGPCVDRFLSTQLAAKAAAHSSRRRMLRGAAAGRSAGPSCGSPQHDEEAALSLRPSIGCPRRPRLVVRSTRTTWRPVELLPLPYALAAG